LATTSCWRRCSLWSKMGVPRSETIVSKLTSPYCVCVSGLATILVSFVISWQLFEADERRLVPFRSRA
jgi:hypothetical protein